MPDNIPDPPACILIHTHLRIDPSNVAREAECVDVSEINIDRMMPFQNNPKYLYDRTVELVGVQYISWPNLQPETALNYRKSAMYDCLAEAGAYYGQSVGWEYPDWFAPEGVEPKVEYSWGRQNWFEYSAAEHRAAREEVILIDLTHMSNEVFPYLTMQEIDIGYAPVKTLRATYVGEVGWELYVPT